MGAYKDAADYYMQQIRMPIPGQTQMRDGDRMYVFDGDIWRYAGKYESARESIRMSLRYANWSDDLIDEMLDAIRSGPE